MMKRINTFLLFLVLFGFSGVNFAHNLETLPSRYTDSTITDLKQLPLDLIQSSLFLKPDGNGSFEIQLSSGEKHTLARQKLRELLANANVIELIGKQLNEPVEIYVFQKKKNKYEKQTIAGLGAVVAAAISQHARNPGNKPGRVLFLVDKNKKIASGTVFTTWDTGNLESVKRNLSLLATADKNLAPWKQPSSFNSLQPPDYYLNATPSGIETIDNEKMVSQWKTRDTAKKIASSSAFRNILKSLKSPRDFASASDYSQYILDNEHITNLIHEKGSEKFESTQTELKTAIEKLWSYRPNPNSKDNFTVESGGSAQRGVVGSKPEGVRRVALIQTDGNKSSRIASAKGVKADAIYMINNLNDAANYILLENRKSGQPVEALLCSHGCPGYMNAAKASSQATNDFITKTRGKISCLYGLGCSVGSGVSSTLKPHLLRDMAVGLGVPAIAAPQTLWSGGSNFTSAGNIVIVKPKRTSEEASQVESFITDSPVWENLRN